MDGEENIPDALVTLKADVPAFIISNVPTQLHRPSTTNLCLVLVALWDVLSFFA